MADAADAQDTETTPTSPRTTARGHAKSLADLAKNRWNNEADEAVHDSAFKTGGIKALRTTVRAGVLRKRGHRFKTWRERYFVLTFKRLAYFEEEGGTEKGQVPFGIYPVTVERGPLPSAPTNWTLTVRGGKSPDYKLELAASSEEVLVEWVKAIQQVTEELATITPKLHSPHLGPIPGSPNNSGELMPNLFQSAFWVRMIVREA